MPRILCTTVHAATQDPDATDCRQACCVSGLAATRGGAPLRRWWAHGGSGGWCRRVLAPECLQQRLGLLEVGRVKALGEPAIDRRQQLVGFGPLALLLPQAARLMAARSSQDLACWRRAMARACWKQASAWAASGTAWRSSKAPWSRYASASRSPWPLASISVRASASRRSPSSTWPTCPAVSASRSRWRGRNSALPRGQDGGQPLADVRQARRALRPAWPVPSRASRSHAPPRPETAARSPGPGGPRHASGPPASHGVGNETEVAQCCAAARL